MSMPVIRPLPIETKGKSFFKRLFVWLTSIRRWEVVEDWHFTIPDGNRIVIPSGFIFDGASIPRFLWGLLSPVGLLLVPGLIHDYGYKHNMLIRILGDGSKESFRHGAGQKYFDQLFLDVAKQVNGMSIIDYLAWLSLRLFGRFAWNGHRERDTLF